MSNVTCRHIANLKEKGFLEMWNRVYDTDGVCPTLPARGGGYESVKVIIYNERNKMRDVRNVE